MRYMRTLFCFFNQLEERLHKEKANKETDLSDLWNGFRSVIEASDGLGTFPFEQIADFLTEIGAFFPESAAFDQLYEVLTDKMVARRSEGRPRNVTQREDSRNLIRDCLTKQSVGSDAL